ncbi:hypothetical protein [Microvirga sp. VF16]|uniref:hypothetical protein n=1 Tax=Microvirga sp. VF16 TaxID=2807101 RepID=UPI00193C8D33|nr:hypothetical protein [Microvirga sp. VF16]QRM32418.1 hypothetical protein JO965_30400 [Microvirga sp. VF16]
MLDAELAQLRDDNTRIAGLLDRLEKHLAQPLPSGPPYHVLSEAHALHDKVYEMARMVGNVKRRIRVKILQHTLAMDISSLGGNP